MLSSEEKIIAALQRMDDEARDDEQSETLGQVWSDMIRGQSWFLFIWPWLGMIGMTSLGVFAAVRFFGTTETRELTLYASLFLFAMMAIGMMKTWFWLRWLRNSIMREIKRMELRALTTLHELEKTND